MENNGLILVDVGNTNIKLLKNGIVSNVNMSYLSFLDPFYYINVNTKYVQALKKSNGIDISSLFKINTSYQALGTDRIAICSIIENGIIIDAGSAITIDKMQNGIHKGGIISLGLKAIKQSFTNISPVLDKSFCSISLDDMPNSTDHAISYSVFKPLKLMIEDIQDDLPLYFTGGDGKLLSTLFKNSSFDELMVFKAMNQVLKLNS